MDKILQLLRELFAPRPVRLAIVRRYRDANGSNVGELYIEQERGGVRTYNMVGMSLDTLPFELSRPIGLSGGTLDTDNDFLAPMPNYRVRVGALSPQDNDSVREMVARLPRRRMTLTVQNRFIEHVLEAEPMREEKWPNE